MIRSYSDVPHGGKWIRSWVELLAELIIEHNYSVDLLFRFHFAFLRNLTYSHFPHIVHASGSRPSSGKISSYPTPRYTSITQNFLFHINRISGSLDRLMGARP
jgi:hypothetical protein